MRCALDLVVRAEVVCVIHNSSFRFGLNMLSGAGARSDEACVIAGGDKSKSEKWCGLRAVQRAQPRFERDLSPTATHAK